MEIMLFLYIISTYNYMYVLLRKSYNTVRLVPGR